MKYPRLDMGQIEAIVNILGGMEGVEKLLRREISVRKPVVFLEIVHPFYPRQNKKYRVVVIALCDLGFKEDKIVLEDIENRALELGLRLCPSFLGGKIRWQVGTDVGIMIAPVVEEDKNLIRIQYSTYDDDLECFGTSQHTKGVRDACAPLNIRWAFIFSEGEMTSDERA